MLMGDKPLVENALRGVGRPPSYDAEQLREIWLYVREGMNRLGVSAKAFCDRHEIIRFSADKTGAVAIDHAIGRETLRRRYYDVEKMLREEAQLLGLQRSFTQEAWESLLNERLAAEPAAVYRRRRRK